LLAVAGGSEGREPAPDVVGVLAVPGGVGGG
jgi:hypothetical protein